MRVKDDFKAGSPVSQVPASWFNSVASFLNNLVGGLGIRILRDANPPQVALDVEKAKLALAVPSLCPNAAVQSGGSGDTQAQVAENAPEDVGEARDDDVEETDSQKIARIGTSPLAARADHVHNIPSLFTKDKTFDTGKGVKFKCGDGVFAQIYTSGGAVKIVFDAGSGKSDIFVYNPQDRYIKIGNPKVTAVTLGAAPTDTTSTDTTHVATLGWVNGKFWRKITTATGLLFNTNGTLSHKSIGTASGTVAAGDHNHDSAYAAKTHNHDSAYAAKNHTHPLASHTHAAGDINATAASGLRFVVFANGAASASIRAIHLEDLKYTESDHSGNCLVKVDGSGNVTHTGNDWYDALEALVAACTTSNGAFTDLVLPLIRLKRTTPNIDFHFGSSSAYTDRIIAYDAGLQLQCGDGRYAYLNKHPEDTTNGADSNSIASRRIATIGLVNTKLGADDPTDKTTISPAIARVTSGSAPTADTATWTAGGTNGLAARKLYRVVVHAPSSGNNAPVIYGFYRTETYDAKGRLYSVSAETRQVIDETVLLTWGGG